jgi:hypothetical protein
LLEDCNQATTSGQSIAVRSEKLVAEAGDSSGYQRKGSILHWKALSNNLTENTGLCVMLMCTL